MRRIVFLSLIGALALVTHFEESEAFATGRNGEAKLNGTVTNAAVPSVGGSIEKISISTSSNGTGVKSQREIGDEITQLFFGEADSVAKSGRGPGGVVTQLQTIADNVQVVPIQQEDTNVGKAIDSLAFPIDSITIIAEEEIQQTIKNVDELISQARQEANNFGGAVSAGDSSTVSEIGRLPPTETTGSKIFQVGQEAIIETADPSVTTDIVTSTTGDGFQTNAAGAQEIANIVGVVVQTTTQIPIFVNPEELGQLAMERQDVLSVQVNPNTKEGIEMKSSFNIPESAKQIPIFINSKINHAVFNIHLPASTPISPVHGVLVDKANDSSLEIEVKSQQPGIQSTGAQMPNLFQVTETQDINLEKPDSMADLSGITGITQIQQETRTSDEGSFGIDKIIIGVANHTETTPADTFAIGGIISQTDTNGDQFFSQVQQGADIQNIISDERAMRSALASLANRMNPAQQVNVGRVQSPITKSGHIINRDFDDDNISLEVIGFIPNNQRGIQNQTVTGNKRPLLVKFDDDGSISTEILGHINENQTIIISNSSDDATLLLSHDGNRQNGNGQTMTISGIQTAVDGEINGEIDIDLSIEKEDGQTQAPTNPFRNSDEQNDLSLEVNLNLLPKIKSLLLPQLPKKGKHPGMVFFRHSEEQNDVSLEINDILANPVFQQKLQEMDDRLKSVPATRGKRLMEKYAEALALSSTSAAATINFSLYLQLLVACLLVYWFP